MLGEHGKHIADCLENNYIGAGFVKDYDLTLSPYDNEQEWRKLLVEQYLSCNTWANVPVPYDYIFLILMRYTY